MGLVVSLILIAVGAILTWAVHPAHPGSVNVHVVGVILMIVGLVGGVLDLMLWSSWGPGVMRRRRTVYAEGAAPVAPAAPVAQRRVDVVEEDVPPAAGPPL